MENPKIMNYGSSLYFIDKCKFFIIGNGKILC